MNLALLLRDRQLLLGARAELDCQGEGFTPLHSAVGNGHKEARAVARFIAGACEEVSVCNKGVSGECCTENRQDIKNVFLCVFWLMPFTLLTCGTMLAHLRIFSEMCVCVSRNNIIRGWP